MTGWQKNVHERINQGLADWIIENRLQNKDHCWNQTPLRMSKPSLHGNHEGHEDDCSNYRALLNFHVRSGDKVDIKNTSRQQPIMLQTHPASFRTRLLTSFVTMYRAENHWPSEEKSILFCHLLMKWQTCPIKSSLLVFFAMWTQQELLRSDW